MPELTEASKHVMIEETKNGLNIEVVDQNGRSMFPEGSKEPYDRTRRLIERLAAPLKSMPFRVSITGHTSASKLPAQPGYGPWELSADRANSARRAMQDSGLRPDQIDTVRGYADRRPRIADDPLDARNRRISIVVRNS